MGAIQASNVESLAEEGLGENVGLFRIRRVTDADTWDADNFFHAVKAATFLVAGDDAPTQPGISSDTVLTFTLTGLLKDTVYVLVIGPKRGSQAEEDPTP